MGLPEDVQARHSSFSSVRTEHPGEDAHQGGLPRPIGPQKPKDLPGAHRKADLVQDL